MRKTFIKYVSTYLVMAMFVIGIVPRAYAGFSPSEVVAFLKADRSADLGNIQKILEMKMIRERLDKLGFSEHEIQRRLGQLSDQQIHQLALTLGEFKVGGDAEVLLILLLAIALGVVLYLWLTGHEVIIKK